MRSKTEGVPRTVDSIQDVHQYLSNTRETGVYEPDAICIIGLLYPASNDRDDVS